MPDKNKDVAYQLLEHFAEIAPYTSFNLAKKNESVEELQRDFEDYRRRLENPIKNETALKIIRSDLQARADSLNIQLDFNTNEIKNLPPLFTKGKYLNWYQHTLTNIYNPKLLTFGPQEKIANYIHYHDNNVKKLDEKLFATLLNDYLQYELLKEKKTAACGDLVCAGIHYLITQTNYAGSIHRISSVNVDHTFIIINCDTLPEGNFTLDKLPKDAIVIDSWMRCSFTADKASYFYADLSTFRKTPGDTSVLTFENAETLTPKNVQEGRAYFQASQSQQVARPLTFR